MMDIPKARTAYTKICDTLAELYFMGMEDEPVFKEIQEAARKFGIEYKFEDENDTIEE